LLVRRWLLQQPSKLAAIVAAQHFSLSAVCVLLTFARVRQAKEAAAPPQAVVVVLLCALLVITATSDVQHIQMHGSFLDVFPSPGLKLLYHGHGVAL
jgi:hypothetical protein